MSHNHRSSGSIQQKIRENIEQHRLSDDQLSQLSKMQSDYDEDASMKPRYTLAKIPVSIVACLVLAISAGYFAPREIWDQTTVPVATQQELLTSIAE